LLGGFVAWNDERTSPLMLIPQTEVKLDPGHEVQPRQNSDFGDVRRYGRAFLRAAERADWLADEHGLSHGYASAIVHEYELRRRLRLASEGMRPAEGKGSHTPRAELSVHTQCQTVDHPVSQMFSRESHLTAEAEYYPP
jgi:hypothetical protein